MHRRWPLLLALGLQACAPATPVTTTVSNTAGADHSAVSSSVLQVRTRQCARVRPGSTASHRARGNSPARRPDAQRSRVNSGSYATWTISACPVRPVQTSSYVGYGVYPPW